MIGPLLAVSLLALVLAPQDPALADVRSFTSLDDVQVRRVEREGELALVDVLSTGAPATEVFQRLAQQLGVKLAISPGEARLRSVFPVDAHLRSQPAPQAAQWLAASVGLSAHLGRKELRLDADLAETTPPDALMRRALDHYRLALIKHPDHPEAPRIHFEIANMHVLLGEDSEAIELYARLQTLYPTYTDVDLALYRMGHAYSRLDDQPSAVRTWSRLLDQYPDSHLAPAVYFELARAFRNSGDLEKSHLALRHLVEGMRSKLSPRLLVSTAWLLCEGQDFERAAIAFRKALLESQEGEVAEEALAGLAQAEFGLQRWENLSKTLKDFHKRFPESRYAADLQLLLAREHRELGDPFTAVLALHRARELNPSEDILAQCDWIEGEIYAAAGLHSRALPLLFQAGQATTAEVSVPALRTHAKLALKRGYFEKARNSYERLAKFPLQRVPAQIGLAHVARSQRNYRQALVIIEETLALTVDRAERQQLLNLASEVIRTSPAVLNKPEDLSDDS